MAAGEIAVSHCPWRRVLLILLAGALAGVPPAPSAAANPTYSISPSAGPVGQPISIDASGLGPGEQLFAFWACTDSLGGGYSNQIGPATPVNGHAHLTYTPTSDDWSATQGKYPCTFSISVERSGSDASAKTFPFTLTGPGAPAAPSSLTITSANSGQAGTPISIKLGGFMPGETASIYFGGTGGQKDGVLLGQATIAADGTYASPVPSPFLVPQPSGASACTTCLVQAIGRNGWASDTFTRISCPPLSSSVSPSSITLGGSGASVTFLASGFAPKTPVGVQTTMPGGSVPGGTASDTCQVS